MISVKTLWAEWLMLQSMRYGGRPVWNALKVKAASLNCLRHSTLSGSQWSCLRSALEENGGREHWFTTTLANTRDTYAPDLCRLTTMGPTYPYVIVLSDSRIDLLWKKIWTSSLLSLSSSISSEVVPHVLLRELNTLVWLTFRAQRKERGGNEKWGAERRGRSSRERVRNATLRYSTGYPPLAQLVTLKLTFRNE